MFRRLLLPCACFIVALGLVAVAMPTLGWGQDRTTQERLDRLERDLNMLLRQVYRGAPPPPAGADGSAGVNTEIRMERLEDRMRDLTGRVEELMNQVNQVRQRVKHPVFEGIDDGAYFYFVHSYYPAPDDPAVVIGETDYGVTFASVLAQGNVVATQFHPEKSGKDGLRFYGNFLRLAFNQIPAV